MQLFYKEYPGSGKTLLILHGLFGMLDNWHNLAGILSQHYRVFTIDLRNHGQSPHSDVINYPLMATDLWEFMQQNKLSQAYILGHSMGGKVAMEFALQFPEKCQKLVVVDIAPVRYEAGHNEIFKALFSLDIENPEKSRKELDDELALKIPEFGVRQFLLKSLARKEEGGYSWKFNLEAIHAHYDDIIAELAQGRSYNGPTLFIRGGNSAYIKDDYLKEIESLFPNYQLKTVIGSGHWVHAEKPKELIEEVTGFLEENELSGE